MIVRRTAALLLAFCLALPGSILPAHARAERELAAGRELTADFRQGRYERIWDRMTEEMHAALGSAATLGEVAKYVESRFGTEKTVVSEEVRDYLGYHYYSRVSDYDKAPRPIVTQWTIDRAGKIAGFFIRPRQEAAASAFLDYENKAELRLPFDGEWYVTWGGRTPEDNYHAVDKGQRFAYDFLIARDDSSHGASHGGKGAAPEDYYCWDRPILAAAPGTVVRVVDGLPDNPIGTMDAKNPGGNHVVVDLGHSEYAFFAHLRQGSVAVREGESVAAGQELGRCGNSGNSSEPHLHFHLQTTPDLGTGEGLPAAFRHYTADGKPVAKGEPLRGQIVAPQRD